MWKWNSTGDMNILRVGQIASTTLGAERGGTVTVKPGGKLTIDARGMTKATETLAPEY